MEAALIAGEAALPTDPHDRVRVHPRRRAAADRHRRRRRIAQGHGHDRVLRHARSRRFSASCWSRCSSCSSSRSRVVKKHPARRQHRRPRPGRGGTDMVRATSVVSRSAVVASALVSGCTVGPELRAAGDAVTGEFRFAQVRAGGSAVRSPLVAVFDDPVLQALDPRGAAQQPRRPGRGRARARKRAPARASRSRSRIRRWTAASATPCARHRTRRTEATARKIRRTRARPTDSSSRGSSTSSGGSGARPRRRIASFYATDQARRGVLITLVGDVATNYFLLRELDLQLVIARQTLTLNDQTVTYFRNRLEAACPTGSSSTGVANRSQTSAAIPDIERQIAMVENAISMLLGRPPGPITRPLETMPELPPAIPPGLPASLLERRPDVMAGRAVARRRQRRRRRGQGAFLSDDRRVDWASLY